MSAEPTREDLIRDVRAGSWSAMQKAADLLEADAKALGEKDAEIARLGTALEAFGGLLTRAALVSRIAELEALVREMKAFFDVLDSKYGMYSERPTDWLKRAGSLLLSSEKQS